MKYLKFIKRHKAARISEGTVVRLEDKVAKAWEGNEHVEEATKSDYNAYQKQVAKSAKRVAPTKKVEKYTGQEKDAPIVKVVDQLDLEANERLVKAGIEVGQSLQVNNDGSFMFDKKRKSNCGGKGRG